MTPINLGDVDTTKTRRRIEEALRKAVSPEKLFEIARLLGVEIAMLPTIPRCNCCDLNRPDFGPDQVRCVCQIKVGLHYLDVYGGKDKSKSWRVVVTKEPFYKGNGWWIEVEKEYDNLPGKKWTHRQEISLTTLNIHSTPSCDNWNKTNWLAFTDNSRHLACTCRHHHCRHHCHYHHCHGACC